jgi:hypothetical protein
MDFPVGAAIFIIPELAQPMNGIVLSAFAADETNADPNNTKRYVNAGRLIGAVKKSWMPAFAGMTGKAVTPSLRAKRRHPSLSPPMQKMDCRARFARSQ